MEVCIVHFSHIIWLIHFSRFQKMQNFEICWIWQIKEIFKEIFKLFSENENCPIWQIWLILLIIVVITAKLMNLTSQWHLSFELEIACLHLMVARICMSPFQWKNQMNKIVDMINRNLVGWLNRQYLFTVFLVIEFLVIVKWFLWYLYWIHL